MAKIMLLLKSGGAALALALVAGLAFAPAAHAQGAQELYQQNCAVCHGPDGAGHTLKGRKLKVKDLTSAEVQKLSDAQLAEAIAKGKPPNMDGFSGQLSKAQIDSLVALIRQLGKH